MTEKTEEGEKLLTAVERLVASADVLMSDVDRLRGEEVAKNQGTAAEVRLRVAARLVSSFSNRTAISGGLSAAPAILPGVGTIAALVGGTLADMALMLKFEVELAMSLCYAFGYDIRAPRERQLAFMLASVSTYSAKAKRNFFVDLAAAQGEAIWNYSPRQLSKALVSVTTKIALLSLSKSLARGLPFVGIAVGAGMNKMLTKRVGDQCIEQLKQRRELDEADADKRTVVKARVRGEGSTKQ